MLFPTPGRWVEGYTAQTGVDASFATPPCGAPPAHRPTCQKQDNRDTRSLIPTTREEERDKREKGRKRDTKEKEKTPLHDRPIIRWSLGRPKNLPIDSLDLPWLARARAPTTTTTTSDQPVWPVLAYPTYVPKDKGPPFIPWRGSTSYHGTWTGSLADVPLL